MLSESILGRAQERGFIRIEAHQIRDYTANKQNQVDDYPYGGGHGRRHAGRPPLPLLGSTSATTLAGPVHTIYHVPLRHTPSGRPTPSA